jgi:hypothetical protein
MIDIMEAILKINPDAKVIITGADIDTCDIQFVQETVEISRADIKTKITELQAAYDALEWKRNREKEYPSWQDQMDDIYHNGIDGWKATIKVTKDKYPKE